MQNQYINKILDIPELQIQQIMWMGTNEIHIAVTPTTSKQSCPICKSDEHVILKGSNDTRSIRHLPAFEKKVYLLVPTIRMQRTHCNAGFVWIYDFVGPKRRYSNLFRAQAAQQAIGSTAAHSARMQLAPASTIQGMHNEAVPLECERLSGLAWGQAIGNNSLVLGVDDFAIKKGHTYNTGIHDLKGEMMLDLLLGRKLDDLRAYAQDFLLLAPKAVVMDLAQAYHT